MLAKSRECSSVGRFGWAPLPPLIRSSNGSEPVKVSRQNAHEDVDIKFNNHKYFRLKFVNKLLQ